MTSDCFKKEKLNKGLRKQRLKFIFSLKPNEIDGDKRHNLISDKISVIWNPFSLNHLGAFCFCTEIFLQAEAQPC